MKSMIPLFGTSLLNNAMREGAQVQAPRSSAKRSQKRRCSRMVWSPLSMASCGRLLQAQVTVGAA